MSIMIGALIFIVIMLIFGLAIFMIGAYLVFRYLMPWFYYLMDMSDIWEEEYKARHYKPKDHKGGGQ